MELQHTKNVVVARTAAPVATPLVPRLNARDGALVFRRCLCYSAATIRDENHGDLCSCNPIGNVEFDAGVAETGVAASLRLISTLISSLYVFVLVTPPHYARSQIGRAHV